MYSSKLSLHNNFIVTAVGRTPGKGKIYFFLYRVQTGSEAHPASCPKGTGESYKEVKLASYLPLIPRSRIVEL
jgi:hypothetical protein